MFGWLVRIMLFLSGVIAGWFVAQDDLNYDMIRLAIMLLLVTLCVAIVAFWRNGVAFFKNTDS